MLGAATVGVGFFGLRGVTLVKGFGLVSLGDNPPPVSHHLLVGLKELDVGVAVVVANDPPCLLQALVELGLGQRIEDVDGLDGRLGGADEVGDG